MRQLLLIVILIGTNVLSQSEQFSVSAHLGYGFSNSMWNGGGTNLRSTFNAGVEFRKRIKSSNFHFQSGFRWNEYGFRHAYQSCIEQDGYFICEDVDARITIFFASIPAIFTYKFQKGIPGLTISAGPQISVYVTDKSIHNDDINWRGYGYPPFSLSTHYSLGYEKKIGEKWMLGIESYSNLNFPIGWFFGLDGNYNFGLALSGRYILK